MAFRRPRQILSSLSERGRRAVYVIAASFLVLITVLCVQYGIQWPDSEEGIYIPQSQAGNLRVAQTGTQAGSQDDCKLVHTAYVSSAIEKPWIENVEEWSGVEYCNHLLPYKQEINLWLNSLKGIMGTQLLLQDEIFKSGIFKSRMFGPSVPKAMQLTKLYSKFIRHYECGEGDVKVFEEWIEPLFGFLRHPLSCCTEEWQISGIQPIEYYEKCHGKFEDLLSRDYILLSSEASSRHVGANTKWYFDLGASTYLTGAGGLSQQWFVDMYKLRGIDFDRMMMWEAQVMNGSTIMNEVPKEILHKYQYFNQPVSVEDPKDPSNPLNIIKKLCKPEDFVALKIDIDNPYIENVLMDRILAETELHDLIDEIFYEHHVNFSRMWEHWGTQNTAITLTDSYRIFLDLRKKGIRMHGWP